MYISRPENISYTNIFLISKIGYLQKFYVKVQADKSDWCQAIFECVTMTPTLLKDLQYLQLINVALMSIDIGSIVCIRRFPEYRTALVSNELKKKQPTKQNALSRQ